MWYCSGGEPSLIKTLRRHDHHRPHDNRHLLLITSIFILLLNNTNVINNDAAVLLFTLVCAIVLQPLYQYYLKLENNKSATNETMTAPTQTTAAPPPPAIPKLIRAQILAPNNNPDHEHEEDWSFDNDIDGHNEAYNTKLPLFLKRCDEHDSSVIIYHIRPICQTLTNSVTKTTVATSETELGKAVQDQQVSCELLSVNDHKVRGSIRQAEDMIVYYLEKHGKVNILASCGNRPRGSLYLMAKNTLINRNNNSNDAEDIFSGTDSNVDGLSLEENEGRVRIVAAANDNSNSNNTLPTSGFFAGLRLNNGDRIYSIDGIPISSISDVRTVLKRATTERHKLVPILTYNVFRRLKTTVMTAVCSNVIGRGMIPVGKPVNIEDMYDVHEKLGEGAFAVVKKATDKKTGQPYALKIVNRSSLNKDMEVAIKDEISILKELEHDHIMQLENVVVTINHYYLVAEYLEGGELFDRIVDKSSYTENEARDVCKILFGALAYMHEHGIVHRDLKPENLLLQYKHSDSEIKIADFGFAKQAKNDQALSTMCGTPGYVAPEVLRKERYGTKADMWSMGVIVFIMLGGYPPFYADNPRELLRMTKAGKFEFDPEYWGDISTGIKEMIRSLLNTNPAKRASAQDILLHPWMMEDKYKLNCMSLAKTQVELKKYIARMRFKKAIHSILFVNTFTGENAVFSGRNKRRNIRKLEAVLPE